MSRPWPLPLYTFEQPALNDYENEPADNRTGSSSVAPNDNPSSPTAENTDPREEGDSPPPVKRKKTEMENGAGPSAPAGADQGT